MRRPELSADGAGAEVQVFPVQARDFALTQASAQGYGDCLATFAGLPEVSFVDYQEASTEVDRLLSAEHGSLVHGEGVSVRPPAALGSWRISEGDKEFLSVHGLPSVPHADTLLRIGALFQSSSGPEYAGQGWSGYVIGQYGDVKIVVHETSGSVFAVPDVREMAPALAHVHPDGIQDELINCRVVTFVDFCWRWYWLALILVYQRDRADRPKLLLGKP
ncbi:SUKH-4 family immunity protein [Streptomyces rishiriensis]|uniref:SUKH-4 family immunity protein n=1 Tax=Streptomyces rishiriensis TaxID=68264 RepID=UPI0037CE7801